MKEFIKQTSVLKEKMVEQRIWLTTVNHIIVKNERVRGET